MLNDRVIVILHLPVSDLTGAISVINTLHTSTLAIKEYNSVFREGVLLSRLFSKTTVCEIVKNIHKKTIGETMIYALPLTEYKSRDYESYNPPNCLSLTELVSDIGDQFCVANDNNISIMTMHESFFTTPGQCAAVSPSGLFVAVAMGGCVVIYGNNIRFDQLGVSGVTNLYFGSDVYLVLEYKELFEFVMVVNVASGRKVFNGRIGKNRIGFIQNGFYIENTNKIFLNNASGSNEVDDKGVVLFDKKYNNEKFIPTPLFFGYEESQIVKIHQHKNITTILTNEKVPHIVIIKDNEVIKNKNYVNLEDCRFVSSNDRLYFLITKMVNERLLTTIESLFESTFTFTTVDSFSDISVSDKAFVIFTKNNELCFYELESVFILRAIVKKAHKTTFSLNRNGKTCVVYDYDKDKIEFYDRGLLIGRHSHSNCNSVKWSQSGLYCATMSVGSGSSGLVQVFNVNGQLVWKRLFNRLSTFEWKGFYESDELVEDIELNYKEWVKDEALEVGTDQKMEEEKRKWMAFLEMKRKDLAGFV